MVGSRGFKPRMRIGGWGLGFTWTPKVGKIMTFMAIITSLGLLFCILLGFSGRLGACHRCRETTTSRPMTGFRV